MMGFSTELQGRASHDALLRMQDTEIRLLECIKKCVTQRIKTDRDYATALTNIVNTAHKFENSEFNGPIFVAWDTIVKETENQVKFIQDNMDKLCTKTLDKIHQLITEKKNTRKFYNDEKQRLEMEFAKLKEEVQKQKAEYEKSIEKVGHDKAKYEDLYMKTTTGKSGSKFEEAKNRYHRTTIRMHKVHNDYVLALNEVSFHQDNYLNTMLPSLLDYQQSIQQAMVQQCKEIMCEYSELTDFSSDSFSQSYNSIHTAVSVIKPTTEYNSFVDANRSDQLISAKFEFDKNLLEEYKGTLQANEIALDDLTVENLNHIRSSYDDKMTNFQQKRESKEKDLKVFDEELAKMPAVNQMDEMTRQSFNAHERACQMLKREIQELQCCENKFRSLYNLVNKPLSQLGDEDPPKGLELAEMDSNSNTNPRDSASPSGGSLSKFEALKTQLMKSSPFKKISGGPAPTVQSKNHLETGSGGTTPSPRESKKISRTESHISTDGYQQYRVGENQQPEMTLQPNRKLDEEEWFHGVLPREEVQRLLVEDGDYLVRESKNRKTGEPQYVLSVYWQGHKHFIIQGHENQWRFEGEYFPTIQELILNQHKSGQPVTNKSQAILHKAIYREDWELNNDDIDLCEKIGNGNFGEVFRGVYKKRQLEVAVKTCRDTLSEDMKKKFLQEGRILKQYDHPNVVKFVGIGAQRTPVMIVMEYVPGGALLNFLRKKGAHQSVRQMVKMCEDASAGMEYLEDRGCIHRDLAARNCLVGKSNTVKISDFGMSREEEEYTVSDGLKQIPIKWTAPEALNYGRYTSLCDVWSFGILMWEVFSCGATPYPGLTNNQARDKIDNGYRMPAPEKTPDAIYRLMLRCWEQEPEQRPHFNDIHKDLVHIQKTV